MVCKENLVCCQLGGVCVCVFVDESLSCSLEWVLSQWLFLAGQLRPSLYGHDAVCVCVLCCGNRRVRLPFKANTHLLTGQKTTAVGA